MWSGVSSVFRFSGLLALRLSISPIPLVKRQLSQTWFHGGSLWISSLRIFFSSLSGFIMRSGLTLLAAALLDFFFPTPLSSWAGTL